jgi:hypothetical protein
VLGSSINREFDAELVRAREPAQREAPVSWRALEPREA